MLKFKVVYSTKISLTFSAIKKEIIILKKIASSIRRTIIYKISEENFKLIGQAVLKSYSDHRLRKNGFEKNAFKVLSTICMQLVEWTAAATCLLLWIRDGSIQSHLFP